MKILFTGGGSGGHFYPIIGIVEAIENIAHEKKLLDIDLYYMASTPYDERLLFEHRITFVKVATGKRRAYSSLRNVFDIVKTARAVLVALVRMYLLFPDVVIGKGGADSFPALFAARFFRIPVIIHETDSVPGSVNVWASRFAQRVATSFEEAGAHFPISKDKIALTGNPLRAEVRDTQRDGAHEFLHLEEGVPVVLILGGSQGAQRINDRVTDSLKELLPEMQVLHQVGTRNFNEHVNVVNLVLDGHPFKERYHSFSYLDTLGMKMAAGAADIIISRAGGVIFEIAQWGVPAILIPLSDAKHDHQKKNAYTYARHGGAIVIEESNLSTTVLVSEIKRVLENKEEYQKMRDGARAFARPDAARLLADEVLGIALAHEI